MTNFLCSPSLEFLALHATLVSLQESGIAFYGAYLTGISGGDITVDRLTFQEQGYFYNMLMEFSHNYGGQDGYVGNFCHNITQHNFENAVLCETQNNYGHISFGRTSVIPAIKDHFQISGKPFRP